MRPAVKRLAAIALAITAPLLSSLLLAPPAFADFFTPKSGGSPNANSIDTLYKIIFYLGIVVFAIVLSTLLYSVFKFRAKKGAVAAQIHGNTRLEVGWTVAAALILVVITVVTFVKLPSIIDPPSSAPGAVLSASTSEPTPPQNGKRVTICVTGRQYIWQFVYGPQCQSSAWQGKLPYSYTEMEAPAGAVVVLKIQAVDVIHSWWIPSLGGKVDAVPGYTTYTWFKPLHPGTFHGQCAQLCGRNHAAMIADVKVVPPAEYQSWLTRQQQQITQANDQVGPLRQLLNATGQL